MGPVPDTAGCRVQGIPKLCLPAEEWGQILGRLAEGPKVSQGWGWPAGERTGSCHGRLQGYSCLGTDVHLLVGEAGTKARTGWLVGRAIAQGVLGLVPVHCGWSRLPVSSAGPWGVLDLVFAPWCVWPRPGISDAQGCIQDWLWAQQVFRQLACWWWVCVPSQLVAWPEMSQYWCLQADEWGWVWVLELIS